jgi:hypothetical protein
MRRRLQSDPRQSNRVVISSTRVLKWPGLEGSKVCGFGGLRQTRMSYLIRVQDVTVTYGVSRLLTCLESHPLSHIQIVVIAGLRGCLATKFPPNVGISLLTPPLR